MLAHCSSANAHNTVAIEMSFLVSVQEKIYWYGMVWYGMVWYGMVWCGMVWYGMVW